MGPKKWRKLPWWQQRVYIEGLESEGILNRDEDSAEDTATSNQSYELDPLGADDSDYRALGIQVDTDD